MNIYKDLRACFGDFGATLTTALIPRRIMTMNDEPIKRGPGRPRKTEEEKRATLELKRARERETQKIGASSFGNELVSPGDNSRYLAHAMVVMEQPPIDISNPQEVDARIKWYFGHCVNSDMKPTVNGMCNALGIHRDTLHTWRTGERRKSTHQEIVLKAYRLLEELWEDYMLNGKVNPVSGIFLAKNMFYGYSDKQELVLTPNQGSIPEAVDAATLEAKYAELPDSED
jgi:hypothetical protein